MAAVQQKSYLEQDMTRDELACVYSALILADDDIPVTEEKIKTILKASDVAVEPLWPALFARALSDCDVKAMIRNVSGAAMAGGVSAGGGGAAAAGGEEAKEEEKKEAAPPEPEEDSDDDFGLSLFD